jgi:hypothetical protein
MSGIFYRRPSPLGRRLDEVEQTEAAAWNRTDVVLVEASLVALLAINA